MNVFTKPANTFQLTSQGKVNSYQPAVGAFLTLISLLGYNAGPSQFIQIWDAASSSDPNAVLLMTVPVPGGQYLALDTPVLFSRGILIVNSLTDVTATPTTAPGAANCWFLSRHN